MGAEPLLRGATQGFTEFSMVLNGWWVTPTILAWPVPCGSQQSPKPEGVGGGEGEQHCGGHSTVTSLTDSSVMDYQPSLEVTGYFLMMHEIYVLKP